MLDYDFMVNAFAASGIVAVVAGIVGVFLVLRGQTFAGHALSHVGFAGATGAVLIGDLAALGAGRASRSAAGVGMGLLGERLSSRDVAIGIVLAAVARLRPAVPALLHVVRHRRRRRSSSATCSPCRRRRCARLPCSALSTLVGAWRHQPPAPLRHACSRNSPRPRACRCAWSVLFLAIVALAVSAVRADRRRAARLHPDGRAGGGGAASDHAARARLVLAAVLARRARPGSASRSPSTPTGRRASGSRR